MDTVHRSFLLTFLGIVLLFSTAITVTLIAPRHVDPTWKQPSSYYQVQMFEVADPNFFISSEASGIKRLEYIKRLVKDFSLLAFEENETSRIIAPPELEKFVTKNGEKKLKLTSRLLLLRDPVSSEQFDAEKIAKDLKEKLQQESKKQGKYLIDYRILELYDPGLEEAFTMSSSEGIIEDFVDQDYEILDNEPKQLWHRDPGVIFTKNPEEYRIRPIGTGRQRGWRYDPEGKRIEGVSQLESPELGFRSRKELIELGQTTYAHEGCWYCHTQQTRTLVQDVVLNGSESYPAPPSAPNEYIYQKVSFPGTRRIGPDLSRVGVKRPSRDWHKAHFWSPRTASAGSIMPSFRHFFDFNPRGTRKTVVGIPNYRFEAVYQYLMTMGTRITPPTEAWWLGKDPVQTLEIIEGRKAVDHRGP